MSWRRSTLGADGLRVVAIGGIAHAALAAASGHARVLARLSASIYLTAGAEIVWLGAAGAQLHPRAILLAAPPRLDGDEVWLDPRNVTPWRPAPLALDAARAATLVRGWRALVAEPAALGTPDGFGARLAGAPLAFPLDRAGATADALADACRRDDASALAEAAIALLGTGGGLTPSGDDFVGAALFARRLLAGAGLADAAAWRSAGAAVLAAASARTHPISVALLGDLAAGLGWAPLHDLVAALASGAAGDAHAAASRLVRLGHSSGWDILAGLGAGLGARPA